MPRWPGPALIVVGLALAFIGAGGAAIRGLDPALLLGAGGLIFLTGLVYTAVRQLRVRSHLPPERYRGPSPFVLLALAVSLALLITIPFTADLDAFLRGEELSAVGQVVVLVSTQVAMLLVAWLFVLRPRALAALPSFLGRAPLRALLTGMAWGLLAWLPATLLGAIVAGLLELVGVEVGPQAAEEAVNRLNPAIVVLAIVVVAPIAEELFFRGVIFNAWLRELGWWPAAIGSAILFAISHLSLAQALPLLALGIAFAWAYRRTGSLLTAIGMHATFNAVSVVFLLLLRYGVIAVPAQ